MNFAPSSHSACSGSTPISALTRQLSQPIPGREHRISTTNSPLNPTQVFRQPVKHSSASLPESDQFQFQQRQESTASKPTPDSSAKNKAQSRLEQLLSHLAAKNSQPIITSDTNAERDLFIALRTCRQR